MKESRKKSIINKKLTVNTLVYSLLVSLAAVPIFFAVLIYGFDVDNNSTRKMAELLHFPAVIVGNHIITIGELNKRLTPVKKSLLESDVSSQKRAEKTSPYGEKLLKIREKYLLNKMIEDVIIEREALAKNVKITSEKLSRETSRELERYGEEKEVQKMIEDVYNWNVIDFQEVIVKPNLYEKGLLEKLRSSGVSENSRKKIEEAFSDLKKGSDFKSVVKKYSEGPSSESDGDLGWLSPGEMLPEVSDAVSELEKGRTSEIIESSLGYHIVKVEDKKNENGQDKAKIRQIFVKAETIGDWLMDREKNTKIYIPLRIFYWDWTQGNVSISDDSLNKFEEELSKNSLGNIPAMF